MFKGVNIERVGFIYKYNVKEFLPDILVILLIISYILVLSKVQHVYEGLESHVQAV